MPVKVRRIDFSPDEWIAGTLGMTLEEEGLYTRIVARIYSRGEALPADPAELARICGVRAQTLRRLLPKLRSKFDETEGKLRSNRCEIEIELARNRIETARFNGTKGGRQTRQNSGETPRNSEKTSRKPRENSEKTPSFLGNSSEFGHVDTGNSNGLAKPGGFPEGEANHHYHLIRDKSLMAGGSSPPLPSRGDGAAASPAPTTTTKAEPEAGTVFDDPVLKAEAVAMLDQCLAVIRGKSDPWKEAAE